MGRSGKRFKRRQEQIEQKQSNRALSKMKGKEKQRQDNSDQSKGFGDEYFRETNYYLQNGLRKVYPYYFTFSTYCKERWFKRKILDVFCDEFRHETPEEYRKIIESGRMLVNNKSVSPDYQLSNGDRLEHTIHRHEIPVTSERIRIIHSDNDVLVVDKPSSIPVHPCGRYRHNSLVFILGKEYGFKNLRTIYRLDRLTSGVLVFGRSHKRSLELEKHIMRRLVEKAYVCRVDGEFPSEPVTCAEPIDVLSHKVGLHQVKKDGKEASTRFERMNYNGTSSTVKCFPATGRTHQIRVHLQYLGYPIINDPLYNSPVWGPTKGKGGDYGKPIDEVIQGILKLHNRENWADMNLRLQNCTTAEPVDLKECNLKQGLHDVADQSTGSKDSNTSADTACDLTGKVETVPAQNVSKEEDTPVNETTEIEDTTKDVSLVDGQKLAPSEQELETTASNLSTIEGDTEPGAKKIKLDESKPSTSNVTKVGDTPDSETIENEDTHKDVSLVDGQKMESSELESETTTVSNLSTIESDTEPEAKKIKLDESEASTSFELKPFDSKLDHHDPQCRECGLTFKDPKPKDLVMFLHAYWYKGPDWEYSTPLPEWAKDDWAEEDKC